MDERQHKAEAHGHHPDTRVRIISLLLALAAFLLVVILSHTRLYRQIELKTLDLRFRLRDPIPVSDDILMVDVDDESLQKYGRWPWSRTLIADLVHSLTRYEAASIFFDIEFIEPAQRILLPEWNEEKVRNDLETFLTRGLIDPDKKLAASFSESGRVYCVFHFDTHLAEQPVSEQSLERAVYGLLSKNIDLPVQEIASTLNVQRGQVEFIIPRIRNRIVSETARNVVDSAGLKRGIGDLVSQVVDLLPSRTAEGYQYRTRQFVVRELGRKILLERFSVPSAAFEKMLSPFKTSGVVPIIPDLARTVKGAGFSNANPDIDGSFRRLPLFLREGDRLLPQAALCFALDMIGAKLESISLGDDGTMVVDLPEGNTMELPLDRNGMFLVNWAGGWRKTFSHLSVSDLLTDRELARVHWQLLQNAFQIVRRGELPLLQSSMPLEEEISSAAEEIIPELTDFSEHLSRMMHASQRLKDDPSLWNEALAKLKKLNRLIENLKLIEEQRRALRGKLADFIGGRACLIGLTASSTIDLGVTPFEEQYPMVGTHATIANSLFTGNFLREPAAWITTAAALLAALLLGLLLPRLGYKTGTSLFLISFFGYFCLGGILFTRGFVVQMLSPPLTIFLTFTAISVYRYRTEESQKRFIKNAFAHYLSPDVINRLLANPENLSLGGEERVLTALFSDVAGFSGISEKLSPPELVALLNEYLTAMTDIIMEHGGTVDKYEGDAIIAFFGAPVPFEDHAARACLASLRMQEKLSEMRVRWAKEGKPRLRARIGLCSGPMVVGNMGSRSRMDYTIMGDNVNLASRLEGANKQYGTYIMVAESTYTAAAEAIEARLIDVIRVVGKKVPVKVYEVLAAKEELSGEDSRWLAAYHEAREFYAAKQWQEALAGFNRVLEIRSSDALASTYVKRCETFMEKAPPPDWDGVHTLTSK